MTFCRSELNREIAKRGHASASNAKILHPHIVFTREEVLAEEAFLPTSPPCVV